MTSAVAAIVSIGIINHYSLVAAFAAPLDFKLLNLLKNVLFQFYHLLFFEKTST